MIRPNVTLWLLLAVCIFNYLDRQIVSILAEPIRRDLQLTDTQLGLMTGLAFALFYAVLGIPIARYADRPATNRVRLISICLVIWSGMTALCGMAQNYTQLLLARIGVGVGEAGCTPPAISLITDSVPRERRASAIAFYGLGGPIGGLLGMVIGGVLADMLGWRAAFLVVGLPGLALALVVWLAVREPRVLFPVTRDSEGSKPTLMDAWRTIRRSRVILPIFIAMVAVAFLSYGKSVWIAVYFIRNHGLSPTEVGLFYGVAAGTAGALGTWLGGRLGDRYGRRDPRFYLLIPALSLLVTVPFFLLAYHSESWQVAIALFFVSTLALQFYYGPSYFCLQTLVAPQMKALVISLLLFVTNLIGLGLGPLSFGMLSDALKPMAGEESVRWVLYASALLGLIPAFFLWWASRYLKQELRDD